MSVDLRHGDNLAVLPTLPDCSVDSIVTDPPYGLSFMGRTWDVSVPVDIWTECLRVLKPGGHLLAFGGTRTWHRQAAAIEDAGFEIRDSIMSAGVAWNFGSGFPKSLNVSRDRRFCQCGPAVPYSHAGDVHGVPAGVQQAAESRRPSEGSDLLEAVQREGSRARVGAARPQGSGSVDAGERGVVSSEDVRPAEPRLEGRGDVQAGQGELHRPSVRALPSGPDGDGPLGRVRDGAPAGDGAVDRAPADAHGVREPRGSRSAEQRAVESGAVSDERGPQAGRGWPVCGGCGQPRVPAGLGTALKPAWEPIVVARKPLAGTVAANVLAYGTGALNVDACRVEGGPIPTVTHGTRRSGGIMGESTPLGGWAPAHSGRWPANVVLTHPAQCTDVCVGGCPVAELDAQSGTTTSLGGSRGASRKRSSMAGGVLGAQPDVQPGFGDTGGASRFFATFRHETDVAAPANGSGDGGCRPGHSTQVLEESLRTGGEAIPTFRYQAKAPASERPKIDGQGWPTVKPLALMRWLVRLVTPPGGLVLDPFAGTGATLQASELEGFDSLGVELDDFAYRLACQRLNLDVRDVVGHEGGIAQTGAA